MISLAPRFFSFAATACRTMRRKVPSNLSVARCGVRSIVCPVRSRPSLRVPSHSLAASLASWLLMSGGGSGFYAVHRPTWVARTLPDHHGQPSNLCVQGKYQSNMPASSIRGRFTVDSGRIRPFPASSLSVSLQSDRQDACPTTSAVPLLIIPLPTRSVGTAFAKLTPSPCLSAD